MTLMLNKGLLILITCLALMLPAQSAVVFDYGSSWKYFIGTTEASSPNASAWRALGFNDSAWPNNVAPIGYGESDIATPIPSSAAGGYLSVYFRKTFVIKSPADVTQIDLSVIVDDGAVAWINGTEVGRTNVPEGELAFNSNAVRAEERRTLEITIATNLSSLLVAGTNVVAIHAFNANTGSSDLLLDASLLTQADEAPPIMVSTVPVESAAVSELSQIEVFFDESVTGVTLADLLINGSPIATNLTVYSPRDYLFEFPQPPNGPVNVTWAPGHGITDLALTPHAFAGASWSYTLDPNIQMPRLVISEFMADNENGIKDDDGSRADWLEIYNPGPLAENLEGWFLTDTTNNLTKWRFPSVPMAANSYLLVWASEKNRTNPAAPLHTNFKLEKSGEYLALVNPQTNVVAAFYPTYPPQEKDVSYGRDRVDPSITGYFATPTPRAQNSTSGPGFAPEPVFSLESGLYTNASLTISLSAPAGTIRYTLDGSVPTNSSPAYATPIVINAGTVIKARVFQTGLLPSRVVAKTYHLLDATTRGFSSNLPLLIINTSGRSVSQDTVTRTRAFLALLDAHRGRSSMQAEPDFQGLAGIEIRGQTSAGFPKTPYNLEINDEFGNDLAVPLLDLPADSDWALRNPYSDKCMMNDFLALELHEKMGHYAVRRRFVEVFVDANGGKLVYPGDYRGIYVLLEKIKVDKNRLDLAELTTSHTNEPAITGGYIVKKDKSSPGDVTFSTTGGGGFSGQQLRYHEPKPREITTAQKNWIRNYLNQFERALYAANWLTATGTNHYSWYIDVDSFVDQHWIVEFTKQIDGYRLSNYMHKDRGGKLKMDPIWDWNLSFGNADYLDGGHTNGWYYTQLGDNDHIWLRRLISGTTSGTGTAGDPDFKQRITDRWSELRTNILGGSNVLARIDEIAAYLNEAQVRDFAKYPRLGSYVWPNPNGAAGGWHVDYVTPRDFAGIITQMKKWVLGRFNWIDSQVLKSPAFNLNGAPVPAGFNLTISAPAGTIYYTLDGADPRLPGGAVSPNARVYGGTISVNSNARAFARAKTASGWSGPAVATFVVQTPPLVITEIMYHPSDPPAGSTNVDEDFEYIELKNTSANLIGLNGYRLSGAINFTFSNLLLGAQQRVVVVKNRAAFEARYGTGRLIAGEFTGNLDNSGERLILQGGLQEPILDFSYAADWHPVTDGAGFSLVVADENAPLSSWGRKESWQPSSAPNGSPGQAEAPPLPLPVVVINEALIHTDWPVVDTIELHNLSSNEADIGGWFLTDDFNEPKKFRIPDGTKITTGGFRIFTENDFNLTNTSPSAFSLSSMGDQVYLFSGDAKTNLTGYVHGFEFAAQMNGVTFGRYLTSVGAEHFVAQNANTLGSTNAGPLVRPVVISEIMYRPPDVFANGAYWNNSEDEYIELFNRSEAPVNLFEPSHTTNTWKLDKAVHYEFPANIVIPAGGYLLVVNFDPVRNPVQLTAFRSKYNVPIGAPILGPYRGNLSNGAEALALYMPDAPEPVGPNIGQVPWVLVERIRYSDLPPWPVAADGIGHSLHRKNAAEYGDDPGNWDSSAPTPGRTYTPGTPPSITSQPQSQTVFAWQTAALSVSASDPGSLRYQWRFNGRNIPGATNATLVLTNVQPSAAGQYAVVVFNPSSSAVSSNASLAVIVSANITQQPQSQAVRPGANVTFTVAASSTTPITYQWRFNGLNIDKATNSSLTISNVQAAHEGDYTVMVTDGVGSVPSAPATLIVLINPALAAPASRLLITATVGQVISLGAETIGTLPMRYTWRHIQTSRLLANVVLNSHHSLVSFTAQADSGGDYTLTLTNAAYPQNLSWTNWLVILQADTDNDGLPDSWETAHGLNPNSPPNDLSDANGDADGDGMKNLSEYVAGTDPRNPASYLKVDQLDGGGPASLSFLAASNRTYTVQYRDGLGIAQWQKLLDIMARTTNFTATVTDSGASSSRYYRLLTPAQP